MPVTILEYGAITTTGGNLHMGNMRKVKQRFNLEYPYEYNTKETGRIISCIDKLFLNKGERFLNIGCGENGKTESYAAPKCCYALATDVSLDSLYKSRKTNNNKNVHYIQSTVVNLPFKDNTFHGIAMLEVLEHLSEKDGDKGLLEIYRILEQDGRFVLSVPNKKVLAIFLDPAFFLSSHKHYVKDELKIKLQASRFSIAEICGYGGFIQAIVMIFFYLNKNINSFLKKIRLPTIQFPFHLQNLMDNDYITPKKGGYTLVCVCQKSQKLVT
jgi:ubiquinone/menaquinone biosynthesis C-methylase UbiE